jgi:hypothetical protein
MKKHYSKSNVCYSLIFILVMFLVSIFSTPGMAPSHTNQQISFDFPASYANTSDCQ